MKPKTEKLIIIMRIGEVGKVISKSKLLEFLPQTLFLAIQATNIRDIGCTGEMSHVHCEWIKKQWSYEAICNFAGRKEKTKHFRIRNRKH